MLQRDCHEPDQFQLRTHANGTNGNPSFIRRLLSFVGLLLFVMPMAFAADAPARLAAGGKPLVPIIVAESVSEPTRKTAQTLAVQLKRLHLSGAVQLDVRHGESGPVQGWVQLGNVGSRNQGVRE